MIIILLSYTHILGYAVTFFSTNKIPKKNRISGPVCKLHSQYGELANKGN